MRWGLPSQKADPENSQALQKGNRLGPVHIWQWLGLGILCILFCMGFVFRVYFKSFLWLPVNMHSELKADYSIDPLTSNLHSIQLELIRDAISDQFFDIENGENPQNDRYATVVSELETPVATVTPLYTVTLQPTSLPTGTATQLPTTMTSTHTATSTVTSTQTEQPGTATPLATQAFTTVIPEPTKTKPPSATSTRKPPTQIPPTPKPTQPPPTATKPPTPTKVPPTAPPPPTHPPYPKPTDNPYP